MVDLQSLNIETNDNDYFRAHETAEALRSLSLNIEFVDVVYLRQLDEAIKFFNICKNKLYSKISHEQLSKSPPTKDTQKTKMFEGSSYQNSLQQQIDMLMSQLLYFDLQNRQAKRVCGQAFRELELQYRGECQETCQLYFMLHKLFRQIDSNVVGGQSLKQMLSDIRLVFKTIQRCVGLRKKVRQHVQQYLHDVQRVVASSQDQY